jgi:hypothetical protein
MPADNPKTSGERSKPFPASSGNPEEQKENRNIDESNRQSANESYPEQVNDAQEKESFDNGTNEEA